MDEYISNNVDTIYVIGVGGHGRSVADVLSDRYPHLSLVFYDKCAKQGEILMGKYQVRLLEEMPFDEKCAYFVAIGDNNERESLFRSLNGYCIISVISRRAYISSTAIIGRGCFVGDYSHIGPEAQIGDNCIINTGAIVEHESCIGIGTHISVGAKVCGRTMIGSKNMVGAGSTVIDRVRICDDVVLGAGAVVCSDIRVPGTYVGVPAKKVG